MKLEPLELDGAWRLRPDRRGDERGHLERLFCRETFRELGLKDCTEQVSEVVNAHAGTLRGMHFQRAPHGETKLIRVVRGAVFDVLVDIRPSEQRMTEGEVPGAIIIGRNVLEWRLDPRSEARIPALARPDARIIVMCSEGYASTLAAASLRRIGLREATDLDGGFQAWQAAGLPTRPAQPSG